MRDVNKGIRVEIAEAWGIRALLVPTHPGVKGQDIDALLNMAINAEYQHAIIEAGK